MLAAASSISAYTLVHGHTPWSLWVRPKWTTAFAEGPLLNCCLHTHSDVVSRRLGWNGPESLVEPAAALGKAHARTTGVPGGELDAC